MAVRKRFGLGIVGAGMGAKPHALALQELADEIEVRGVYRRNRTELDAFCARYGFPAAESYEPLLSDPAVDAILILTTPNAREALVKAAAAAGKHVLMEKPVERTTAAAERIVAICRAAGVTLGIIFQLRFRRASQALSARIAEGRLGRLNLVQVTIPKWRPQAYYDEPGRGTLEQDGGGVLMNQGIHTLDLMLSLCGPVSEVTAMTATTAFHRMETEDFAVAGLRFANGAVGSLVATTASYPNVPEQLVLGFANATAILHGARLTIHWLDGRLEEAGEDAEASTSNTDPNAGPHVWHKRQIMEFADVVREGRQPVSSGETALRAHRLIDAILASSREGKRVIPV